jgi:uncharacterized OB-fold protein
MCSECGSIIPKLGADNSSDQIPEVDPATDFGIMMTTPETEENAFGIDITPPPPPPPPDSSSGSAYSYPAYDPTYPTTRQKVVCERCGTGLRPDETQCPGCGKPHQSTKRPPSPQVDNASSPYAPGQPYAPPPPTPQNQPSAPLPPPKKRPPTPPQEVSDKKQPTTKYAKCAKCGAIVYEYETRCSNCGRILAPPSKKPKDDPKPIGQVPPGAARCGRCNAIVYPHQTVCPNCGKPLAPVSTTRGPSQRISRCRRCGHTVYPTDTRCSNCGRKLDPVG